MQLPNSLSKSVRQSLKFKVVNYYIINGKLYWKYPIGVLLNDILPSQVDYLIKKHHIGVYGGHFSW